MRTFLLLVLLLAGGPADATERISAFASEVRVDPDASLWVIEDVTVQAEGQQVKHGILRDFPTVYGDRLGHRVQVGFEVGTVQRDGVLEPYTLERLSNGVRVRIGSADTLLTPGRHRYRLTYRTTRQIGFFSDFDELYWNVTGTGWTLPIDQVTATVDLPAGAKVVQRAFYTGPQDAKGKDARVVEEAPGRIVFATTRPLATGEGLTVAVAWPKGLVTPPSSSRRLLWQLGDNGPPILAGAGSLAILGYYLFAWVRVGRDPARGTIIPLFTPPEGLSAPAARQALLMEFDDRAFASGILSLAVKGRLKIGDLPKGYRLERLAGTAPLTGAETALDQALFAGQDRLDLVQANHERIRAARTALRRALDGELDGPVFRTNFGWFAIGLAGSAALLAATLFLLRAQIGDDQLVGLGLFAGAVAAFLLVLTLQRLRAWWHDRGWSRLALLVIQLLVLATVLGFGTLVLLWTAAWSILEVGLLSLVLAGLAFAFFHLLKAPTPNGRRLLDRIEGFKRYLEVAEEDRLAVLNPPERTPELFERYLPYALALGVEHLWSQKFAGILARSAADGSFQPSWYGGSGWDPSRPTRFADHVGSSLASAAASAATAPGSSSGSGGGGSSGGGGGGGGGGGW